MNIKHKDGRGILWASGAGGSEEVVDLLLMFKSKLNLEVRSVVSIKKGEGALLKLLSSGVTYYLPPPCCFHNGIIHILANAHQMYYLSFKDEM